MTPLDAIQIELARTRERIAELQIEQGELETALRVILRFAPASAKAEPPRAFKPVEKPPVEAPVGTVVRKPAELAGTELFAHVREEAGRRGLSMSACSREIFGNPSQLYQLKAGRERDMGRARRWLAGPQIEVDHDAAFQVQVERVARGEVGITANLHVPRRGSPEGTLGGVTGEINL